MTSIVNFEGEVTFGMRVSVVVAQILFIVILCHTLSSEILFKTNESSLQQQLNDFVQGNVEFNETEWYPLPEGDGPIQAKRYIQFIVTKVLPCLYNYTVSFSLLLVLTGLNLF